MLGLRGLVIKSHGSAEVFGFEWAIKRGYDAVKNGVLERLARAMEENAGSLEQATREAGSAGSASQMASPIAGPISGQPAEPYGAQSSKT